MKKNNIVYLIGAGASKDFGMPLGNEIFEFAFDVLNTIKEPDKKRIFKAVLKDVDKSMHLMYSNLSLEYKYFPLFEEVLTYIWDYRKTEQIDYSGPPFKLISIFKQKNGAKDVFDSFTKLLGLTIVNCLKLSPPNAKYSLYKKFIESLDHKNNDITFISFNYDTILDGVLKECVDDCVIKNYNYFIPLADYDNGGGLWGRKDLERDGVLLLKPHGSVNLAFCNHHINYGFGYYYNKNGAVGYNGETCPQCGSILKPLIIPPLYNKKQFITDKEIKGPGGGSQKASEENYSKLMDLIEREVLEKANEIFIIGYSMPIYDYNFKNLFLTSMIQNKKRDSVNLKIINKAANTNELENLKRHFGNVAGPVDVIESNGFLNYLTSNFQ